MMADRRQRILGILLLASFGLNGALLAYVARLGKFERALVMADLIDHPGDRSAERRGIVEGFRRLPGSPADIVFAGDSLIANGPWAEFFSEIHNRGIRGDTTAGLLARLDEVIAHRPRRIYLLIGTNDLAGRIPEPQIERNYRAILARVAAESPRTEVVALGIPPLDRSNPKAPSYDNGQILALNRKIRALVAEFASYRYVDLTPFLADPAGNLRADLTEDGLHLNTAGYLAVREALARLAPPSTTPSDPGGQRRP